MDRVEWEPYVGRLDWKSYLELVEWKPYLECMEWESYVDPVEWKSYVGWMDWKPHMEHLLRRPRLVMHRTLHGTLFSPITIRLRRVLHPIRELSLHRELSFRDHMHILQIDA